MLSCLKDEGVDFIVVGAYALAAHGFIRATGDLDIWLRTSSDNAQKVLRALARFGAPTSGLSEDDFTNPDTILQLGVEPRRIDLITRIDGVDFEEATGGRVMIDVDGVQVFVLSKRDLLKNKLAVGRDKDQGDIAWLRKKLSDEA
jgi:hypothetical protein